MTITTLFNWMYDLQEKLWELEDYSQNPEWVKYRHKFEQLGIWHDFVYWSVIVKCRAIGITPPPRDSEMIKY